MAKPDDETPILELRNLGPVCEAQLNAVGIRTAGDIRRLGVKETFELAMRAMQMRGESTHGFNACYLYAIYGAVHGIDWRDVPEKKKSEFKAFTKSLREEI